MAAIVEINNSAWKGSAESTVICAVFFSSPEAPSRPRRIERSKAKALQCRVARKFGRCAPTRSEHQEQVRPIRHDRPSREMIAEMTATDETVLTFDDIGSALMRRPNESLIPVTLDAHDHAFRLAQPKIRLPGFPLRKIMN